MQQQMYLHHDPSGKIKRFHSFTVDQINVDGFLQNSLNFFGSDAFKIESFFSAHFQLAEET
jgi:hypothetical protein